MNNSTYVFFLRTIAFVMILLLIPVANLYGEEAEEDEDYSEWGDEYAMYLTGDGLDLDENYPVSDVFGEWMLINSQTTHQLREGSLGMNIQHRFGQVSGDLDDLFGIYAPANVRLEFAYGVHERVQVGLGTTKSRSQQDVNAKVMILRQTEPSGMPVSVSYFGQTTVLGSSMAEVDSFLQRLDFYHQLMVSRSFGFYFSAQLSASYMHFNLVDRHGKGLRHDDFGLSLIGRVRVSPTMFVIFEGAMGQLFYTPKEEVARSRPTAGLGMEKVSSGHSFQVFFSSTNDIIPGQIHSFNPHNIAEGSLFFGFNMTRRWSF